MKLKELKANHASLLILCVLATGCIKNPSKTFIELQQVEAAIDQKAFDAKQNGEIFNLTNAIKNLIRVKGANFFRCGPEKIQWMYLCSEINDWTNSPSVGTDIAIYSQERFFDKQHLDGYFVAVDFQGKPQKLTHAPKWEPLKLWDFK